MKHPGDQPIGHPSRVRVYIEMGERLLAHIEEYPPAAILIWRTDGLREIGEEPDAGVDAAAVETTLARLRLVLPSPPTP
jgi:hypothetical protein